MRKVEARMVQAICDLIGKPDHDGLYLSCGNTTVSQEHHGIAHTPGYQRIISVKLHSNEIAAIRPIEGTVWVSDCGWQTVTTKSRLNTLIHALTRHEGITQRNYQWLQMQGEAAYEWKGHDVFPLRLDADNYFLQQVQALVVNHSHKG